MSLKESWDGKTLTYTCDKHKTYKGKNKPKSLCEECWWLFFYDKGREYFGW